MLPERAALRVEEALAGGGDKTLSASGYAHLVPEDAEVTSGVPLGASKTLSDDPGRVAAGEVLEDDPVSVGQHDGG